jgi:hypothetical protein
MAANSLDFTYYPFSHSLLFALFWGAALGSIHFARVRVVRASVIVGLLVVSHWVLDLPMHRPDLPLAPGMAAKVGFGLWNSIPLTLVLEFGIFGAGVVIYVRGTMSRDRIGSWGVWLLVALLVAILLSGFGPLPTSERAVALGALGLWAIVPAFWWIDRHRSPRAATTPVR